MLTRLRVSGFKNLVDVDIRFGPFTCVAGVNGTGKSNLFDAIQFLSALAGGTLLEAALSVRSEGEKTADVRNLFHRVGDQYAQEMTLEADMIVPPDGVDDLGQQARAAITFLRYTVNIGYRRNESLPSLESLELLQEELVHINVGEAVSNLRFPHKPSWRRSAVQGRRVGAFISTDEQSGKRVVKLHQDGNQGRPREYLAANLPRTVLSSVNALESPTALLARREMQSWTLLQLEPSALRRPDDFTTSPGLTANGSRLPATLNYLARSESNEKGQSAANRSAQVYDQVAARLGELIDDVREVRVDRDERQKLLTLEVTDRSGTTLPARSLSDGTLRFLALSVMATDLSAKGVICLEEPENGIHPERIPAMLQLLQDIAVDTEMPLDTDNPLRQVIINTHSPVVVNQVPDDSLLVAELREVVRDGQHYRTAHFSWLPDTWRQGVDPGIPAAARGKLLAYLNPAGRLDDRTSGIAFPSKVGKRKPRRVADRSDLQPFLPELSHPI